MAAARGAGRTFCPSEVARRLAGPEGDWRSRMEDVHAAVDRLLAQGSIAISWRGRPLPRRAGPYRVRGGA
jgi:hypothetical protein